MKKIFGSFIIGASALALASCGGEEYDLRILTNVIAGKTPDEHNLMEKEIEKQMAELTGKDDFNIEFTKPTGDYDEALLRTLSSGEKYDIIYTTSALLPQYISQEAVLDLTTYISNSDTLSDPTVIPTSEYDLFRTSDNKLYGVPTKYEGALLPLINSGFATAKDVALPGTTIESWEAYFQAFMDKAGAGSYGLCTAGLYELQPFASAWGIKTGMINNSDGTVSVPYASDAAIPFWDNMHKWMSKGYIEPSYATNGTGNCRTLMWENKLATMVYWDAWIDLFNNSDAGKDSFDVKGTQGIVGNVGTTYEGEVMYTRGDSALWAVPANAQNVDNAITFLEYWNSEPGYLLGTLGVEGHDYNKNDNGDYILTDLGNTHNKDHGSPRVQSTTWENPFPMSQAVTDAENIWAGGQTTPKFTNEYWSQVEQILEKHVYKLWKNEYGTWASVNTNPAKAAVDGMKADIAKISGFNNYSA